MNGSNVGFQAIRPGEYGTATDQMVDSFTIENFRSFKEVKVERCGLINILVGDNGSGKTALLEALFLAAGVSPELTLRTRSWRGLEGRMSGTHEDIHEALWADLFFKFQTSKPARIALKGARDHTRSVTVKLFPQGHLRVIAPTRKESGAPVRVVPDPSPIEFVWSIQGRGSFSVKPTFDGEKLNIPPVPETHVRGSFFAANRTAPGPEVSNHFSQLSRTFHEEEFIERFNALYPNIKDLSLEMSGGSTMLFARVDGLPQRIPLSLASGGMSKLAAILLAMPQQAGGIVLVDEIENGFYHKRMPQIWETLLDFARLYKCQLFVSSHSVECLAAAASLAAKNPGDFAVMRTVLESDGTKVRQFSGETFVDAIQEQIEVR
jgi:ABC-type lipoprotein export system ATPase subunit